MNNDKVLIRAKDISLLIMVLTLLGLIAGPAKRIFQLDDVIVKVEKLSNDVADTKTNQAVTNAQYADIKGQLERINWQLQKLSQNR